MRTVQAQSNHDRSTKLVRHYQLESGYTRAGLQLTVFVRLGSLLPILRLGLFGNGRLGYRYDLAEQVVETLKLGLAGNGRDWDRVHSVGI